MKKPISVESINKMAPFRPDGYKEEIIKSGDLVSNPPNLPPGDYIMIEWNTYINLLQKYSPDKKIPKQAGLGSLIATVANPIAKGIDRVLGTNISNCRGCQRRKEYLDNLIR